MSNLAIESFTIKSNLAEVATVCDITLAPAEKVDAPAGEFALPGESAQTTISAIRPSEANTIDIVAAIGGQTSHKVFTGGIEFMDDLEDADQYTYGITMSNTPLNQGHRTKISHIIHGVSKALTSTHGVLEYMCKRVGIPFGRCDLPNVTVYGDYEINRQNVVNVAQEFCEVFNMFDYMHYYVRCDETNGLSIIGVDYSKGGEVENSYDPINVIKVKNSYERYMPENRLGAHTDILLKGFYSSDSIDSANRIIVNSEEGNSTTTTNSSGNSNADSFKDQSYLATASHTYNTITGSDSKNTADDTRVEKTSSYDFLLQYTVTEPTTLAQGYDISDGQDLDVWLSALASDCITLSILNAYPTVELEKQFLENVKTVETETRYTYEYRHFTYQTGEAAQRILTYRETEVTNYWENQPWPQTLNKEWFYYDEDTGLSAGSKTELYSYEEGKWILLDEVIASTSTEDTVEATNTLIAYYTAQNALKTKTVVTTSSSETDNTSYDSATQKTDTNEKTDTTVTTIKGPHEQSTQTDTTVVTTAITSTLDAFTWSQTNEEITTTTTTELSRSFSDGSSRQYSKSTTEVRTTPTGEETTISSTSTETITTIDSAGTGTTTTTVTNESGGTTTDTQVTLGNDTDSSYTIDSGTQDTYNTVTAVSPLNQVILWNGQILSKTNQIKFDDDRVILAFQKSVPWAGTTCLGKIWAQCQREKELEKLNLYWHVRTLICSMDDSITAGESILLNGVGGICSQVSHSVTGDSAITTAEIRRLVVL